MESNPNPFIIALESVLSAPADRHQLKRAIEAHKVLLQWQQDGENNTWKRFIGKYQEIGIVEF